MSDKNITRYRPGIDPEPKDRTDWKRLKSMSEDEVEANAANDPDNPPLTAAELATAWRPKSLRDLRERLGLSQSAFAKRFGVNARTLQDWEQGRRVPDQVARSYLRVIERDPAAVEKALTAA